MMYKGSDSCFPSPLYNQPTHSESDNALYRKTTLTELNLFISNGKQDIKMESFLLSITYVLLQAFPCLIHCKMGFLKFYKNNVLIHLRFNCSTKLFLRVWSHMVTISTPVNLSRLTTFLMGKYIEFSCILKWKKLWTVLYKKFWMKL